MGPFRIVNTDEYANNDAVRVLAYILASTLPPAGVHNTGRPESILGPGTHP